MSFDPSFSDADLGDGKPLAACSPYLFVGECADDFRVDRSTVRRWICSGQLKADRPVRDYRIRRTVWQRFKLSRGRLADGTGKRLSSRPSDFETAKRLAL